jgi:hypothetical protein
LLCASEDNIIFILELNLSKKEIETKKIIIEHEAQIIHLSKIEKLGLAFSADEVCLQI